MTSTITEDTPPPSSPKFDHSPSRPTDQAEATVSFAITRGNNGRRHGVDAEVEVDVAVGSETVEIAVDAKHDQTPSDKRRFATIL